jgi:hypothetical protein
MRSLMACENARGEGAASPGVARSAAVLGTVKARPGITGASATGSVPAVLDRSCVRGRAVRVSQKGGMSAAWAEQKGWIIEKEGGGRRITQQRMIPTSSCSMKPEQVQREFIDIIPDLPHSSSHGHAVFPPRPAMPIGPPHSAAAMTCAQAPGRSPAAPVRGFLLIRRHRDQPEVAASRPDPAENPAAQEIRHDRSHCARHV